MGHAVGLYRWPADQQTTGTMFDLHSCACCPTISVQLDLAEVYSGVRRSMRHYVLRSMFCCSGNQYSAFVRTTDLGAWLLVDSASVSRVGAWHDVLQQCEAGRWQPSMLFYEAV